MVKQIQKKVVKILYRCEVCGIDFHEKHHAEDHEPQCYELQETAKGVNNV